MNNRLFVAYGIMLMIGFGALSLSAVLSIHVPATSTGGDSLPLVPQATRNAISWYDFHVPAAPTIVFTGVYPEAGSAVNNFRIGFDVIGRNIQTSSTTIDRLVDAANTIRMMQASLFSVSEAQDGNLTRVSDWDQGYSGRVLTWDTELPFVLDGTTSAYEFMWLDESSNIAQLEGRYRTSSTSDWVNVVVLFDTNEGQRWQRTINLDAMRNAEAPLDKATLDENPPEVTIPVGAEFQTYDHRINLDDSITKLDGRSYTWDPERIRWEWQPAPTSNYEFGLEMITWTGDVGSEVQLIRVDNEAESLTMRGQNDYADLGITLPRFREWDQWVETSRNNDFAYRSSSPDLSDSFALYFLYSNDIPTAYADRIAQLATNYAFEVQSEGAPLTVTGYNGVQFRYQYIGDDENTVIGNAFVFLHPVNDFVYMLAAETQGTAENLGSLFSALIANVNIFEDMTDVPSNETATWDYDTFNSFNSSFYAYPNTWGQLIDGNTIENWKVYTHPDDLPHVFFATTIVQERDGNAHDILQRLKSDLPNAHFIEETVDAEATPVAETTPEAETTPDAEATPEAETTPDVEVTPEAAPPAFVPAGTDFGIITEQRTLYTTYRQWEAIMYTVERDGVPVVGRLYGTTYRNSTYLLWVEAPEDDAEEVINGIIEYIVDGYQIYGE